MLTGRVQNNESINMTQENQLSERKIERKASEIVALLEQLVARWEEQKAEELAIRELLPVLNNELRADVKAAEEKRLIVEKLFEQL